LLLAFVSNSVFAASPGPTIELVVMSVNSEYWLSVKAGAEAALKPVNGKLIFTGPAIDGDIQGQISLVENAITSHVDGIMITPLDSTALVAPAKKAMAAGIPTIIVDGPINWDGTTSYIATDNVAAAKFAVETLCKLIGGKGKIAVINALAGIPSNDARTLGAEEAVKEFPDVILLPIQRGADQAAALQNTENILTSNPDIAGIFGAYDRGAIGAVQALKNKGLAGKVKMVAFDSADDEVRFLKEGVINALVAQQPFEMGRLAVEYILAAKSGKPVPKKVATNVVLITKDNINTPEIQKVLNPLGK
jgi:ribose transport system substrate-binding protein